MGGEAKYDLVIRNGKIVDGTGNPFVFGDIGVTDGKIARIGEIPVRGKTEIDAAGLFVSPGFIDLHNHVDQGILAFPLGNCYTMQGVTTSVVGNCGLSMAPVNSDRLDQLKRYNAPFLDKTYHYGWDWESFGDFYRKVEDRGIAQNLAPLVGHGTLKVAVMGFRMDSPSDLEMDEMKALLKECMEEGAFGLSTGLIYPPGTYSKTEELIEVASVLAEYDGIYATHLRDEGRELLESVREAIEIGRANGIAVEISHHKAMARQNWGKVKESLAMMARAREEGLDIGCDVYPYTAVSTTITSLLPAWSLEGGVGRMLQRLADPAVRESIRAELAHAESQSLIRQAGPDNIFIAECPALAGCEGLSLEEIFKVMPHGGDPCSQFLDFLAGIEGNASMVVFAMSEEDVKTVMTDPCSAIISDSWVTSPEAGGRPHPRAYGSFPRVLGKYVREEKIFSLEEAVRKMTSLPASRLGLPDRGRLKEDFWADIVIFDPATIIDKATYEAPHQFPQGVNHVIVNGVTVAEKGSLTGARPGKILKKTSSTTQSSFMHF